ncbi:Fe-S protein assembly co-chaperone HscB [Buchnera aphidicola (Formosaphis micheliae)]|uniref:Fe-S protein assembly co-chaperone HscB n=1 Tax=Buchnera aphidicola TaxID=9 RepID=UPI0031CC486C
MNYFNLFSLPQIFNIDLTVLSKNFYQLQRKFHPDLFYNCSQLIQKKMHNQSVVVNQGYKILKNYLKRAEYLLLLNDINIQDPSYAIYEKNFLIEQFQFYEEIEELKRSSLDFKLYNDLSNRIDFNIRKYELEMENFFILKDWINASNIVRKLYVFKKIKKYLNYLLEK